MILPERIPIFPLSGAIVLPRARLPLNIFEPRYLAMVRDALAGPRLIGMIQPLDDAGSSPEPEIYQIGCLGRIVDHSETPDGRILIALQGVSRFRVRDELQRDTPYRQVAADYTGFDADQKDLPDDEPVDRDALLGALHSFLDLRGLKADWEAARKAPDDVLVSSLAMLLPMTTAEKQALLEAEDMSARADILTALLQMAMLEGDDGHTPVQ